MKGSVLSRQNDKYIATFWMPESSLCGWIWAIIKISVKVKMKKLVLNIKDIREIEQKSKKRIEVFVDGIKEIYKETQT